eukprot:scaffold17308_cov149-Skeletonema_dohrnii-CCMP3373.AAC.1
MRDKRGPINEVSLYDLCNVAFNFLNHHVVHIFISHWSLGQKDLLSAREITNIKSMSSATIFILYATKDPILASHPSYKSVCQCQLECIVRIIHPHLGVRSEKKEIDMQH